MCDNYIQEILRRVTAQVCQTIGYNASQTTPLELLQDIFHKYLQEFARDLRRQVEHYNRDIANMDDVMLTLNNLNINVHELYDYINNVEPVQSCAEVPELPAHKYSKLNFLKPGSKEVLLRPMHIYEYLPPILPPEVCEQYTDVMPSTSKSSSVTATVGVSNNIIEHDANVVMTKSEETTTCSGGGLNQAAATAVNDVAASGPTTIATKLSNIPLSNVVTYFASSTTTSAAGNNNTITSGTPSAVIHSGNNLRYDEEGRPTREIHSVVMTTGGFISPAIEGKLPDTIIPNLIEKLQGLDAPPLTPPPLPPPLPLPMPQVKQTERLSSSAKNDSIHSAYDANNTNDRNQLKPSSSKLASTASTTSTVGNGGGGVGAGTGTVEEHSWPLGYKMLQTHKGKTGSSVVNPSSAFVTKLLKKAKKKMPSGLTYGPLAGNFSGKLQKSNTNKFDASTSNYMGGSRSTEFPMPEGAHRGLLKTIQNLVKTKGSGSATGADTVLNARSNTGIATNLTSDMENLPGAHSAAVKSLDGTTTAGVATELKLASDGGVESLAPFAVDNANSIQMNKLFKKQNKKRQKKLKQQRDLSAELQKNQHLNIAHAQAVPVPSQSSSAPATGTTTSAPLQFSDLNVETSSLKSDTLTSAEQQHHQKQLLHTPLEIKLSNEPDRSKLNIFKKISKPKSGNKLQITHSPLTQTDIGLYDTQQQLDSTMLNLPSGTTITPALPTQMSSITVSGIDKAIVGGGTTATVKALSAFDERLSSYAADVKKFGSSDIALTAAAASARMALNVDMRNKPKKRGRKPGCRNPHKHFAKTDLPLDAAVSSTTASGSSASGLLPEIAAAFASAKLQLKKSKKLKSNKMYAPALDGIGGGGGTSLLKLPPTLKPLNLSTIESQNIIGSDKNSHGSATATTQSGSSKKLVQSPLRKKMNVSATATATAAAGGIGGPTKEEVNSINRKLMRMDTTLKPLAAAEGNSGNIDAIGTPTPKKARGNMPTLTAATLAGTSAISLTAVADSPAARAAAAVATANSSATAAAVAAASAGSLSNLPPQMLLPLYSYSPRPGLIPSSTNLLSSSSSAGGAGMMLPTFLPYPTSGGGGMGTSASGGLLLKNASSDENRRDFVDSELKHAPVIGDDRNYCNVAPLVPDSMKLTLIGGNIGRSSSNNPGEHKIDYHDERQSLKPESHTGRHSLLIDEPIEVSDDSRDGSNNNNITSTNSSSNIIPPFGISNFKSKLNSTLLPPGKMYYDVHGNPLADLIGSKESSKDIGGSGSGNNADANTKSSKKIKKLTKSNKQRNTALTTIGSGETTIGAGATLTATDVFRLTAASLKARNSSGGSGGVSSGLDAGISKLAGGADLIPIGTSNSGGGSSKTSLLTSFGGAGIGGKELDYDMSITPTTTISEVKSTAIGSGGSSLGEAATQIYNSLSIKSILPNNIPAAAVATAAAAAAAATAVKRAHFFDTANVSVSTSVASNSGNIDIIDLHEHEMKQQQKQQHVDMQKQKRKEHKKLKKVMKDSRIKKKKDKKDKNKSKEKYLCQHKLNKSLATSTLHSTATTTSATTTLSTTIGTAAMTDKPQPYGKFEYCSGSIGSTNDRELISTSLLNFGGTETTVASKEKELLKKMKKEKKKLKQKQQDLMHGNSGNNNNNSNVASTNLNTSNITTTIATSTAAAATAATTTASNLPQTPLLLPKLTLKFSNRSRSNSQSPTPTQALPHSNISTTSTDMIGDLKSNTIATGFSSATSSTLISSTALAGATAANSQQQQHQSLPTATNTSDKQQRELSPELAKISPLVTRPPKQKAIPQALENVMGSSALGFDCDPTYIPTYEVSNSNTSNNGNSTAVGGGCGSGANSTSNKNSSSSFTHQHHRHHHHAAAIVPPPSPWQSGGTLTASSVLLPQQLLQSATVNSAGSHGITTSNMTMPMPTTKSKHAHEETSNVTSGATSQTSATSMLLLPSSSAGTATAASISSSSSGLLATQVQMHTDDVTQSTVPITASTSTSAAITSGAMLSNTVSDGNRPSSYIDAEGNRVWICPACGKVDDGSAMIGCDDCDAWYHWICVGIVVEPKDNEDWYCRVCITRRKGMHGEKKRKRNKKK